MGTTGIDNPGMKRPCLRIQEVLYLDMVKISASPLLMEASWAGVVDLNATDGRYSATVWVLKGAVGLKLLAFSYTSDARFT